jgi:hypothetical protein
MRRSPLLGGLAAGLVLLFGAIAIAWPDLSKQRDYPASIPQPPSVVAIELVLMKPGQAACLHDAVMDTHSQRALFQVETYGKRTVPLRLSLTGRGYGATVHVPASSYANESIISVPVPAPRRDLFARACLTNLGTRPAAMFATTTAEPGPVSATLNGKPVATNPWLAFYEAKPTSIVHRLPTIVARMGVFRPPLIGGWLLWPLGLLFALGVPVAVVAAFTRALSEDQAHDAAG